MPLTKACNVTDVTGGSGSSSPKPTRSSKPRLWTGGFIGITIANLLIFSGFHMLTSTLALHVEGLGAPEALIGWVTASTTLAAIFVRPVIGAALDLYGRKGLLLVGILALAASVAAVPFFPFVSAVLVMRTLQGIGWGIANTAASTVAADLIPKGRFGEGIGFFGLASSVAMTIAPALSLTLFESFGIGLPMWVSAGGLCAAFVVALFLRYQPIAQITAREKPAVEASAQASRPLRSPLLQRFFERRAILPAVMGFFVMCSYGAIVTFVALSSQHREIGSAALFFVVIAVTMLVSRPVFGKLTDTRGHRLPLLLGLCFIIAGLIVLALAQSMLVLLISAPILGIGYGSANPAMQTMAIASAEPSRRGVATATFFVGFDGGIGIGSGVAGVLVQFLGYSGMYAACVVLPLITAAIYFSSQRHTLSKTS
ncbi:MAG: MFS transporter [Coriobacteriales bacterium]|jgi:MFS family permease|nr:MFS transporter [Coriobacteriales bacterium]